MTRYKKLQIIKHALAHYIQREGAPPQDIATEKLLLAEVEGAVERLKEAYGIDEQKRRILNEAAQSEALPRLR